MSCVARRRGPTERGKGLVMTELRIGIGGFAYSGLP